MNNHDPDLEGRRVLVTGASSGLGRHFAVQLARRGARVALAARRRDRLAAVVNEIEAGGREALAVTLDVDDLDSVAACVAEVERRLGAIDVLVNNSGVSATHRLEEVTPGDFDAVFSTNLRGAFFVAQAVARGMLARADEAGFRAIVNVSSAAGIRPLSRIGPYAASKAALIHLTRSMAIEWGQRRINVNALCPGYVRTELNDGHWGEDAGKRLLQRLPRQRLGSLDDLTAPLCLLCGSAAGFVNGAIWAVDDGLTA